MISVANPYPGVEIEAISVFGGEMTTLVNASTFVAAAEKMSVTAAGSIWPVPTVSL